MQNAECKTQNSEPASELDLPVWSVISEHGVLEHAITRKQAEKMQRHYHEFRTGHGFRLHQGLTIITAKAAARLKCKQGNDSTDDLLSKTEHVSESASLTA